MSLRQEEQSKLAYLSTSVIAHNVTCGPIEPLYNMLKVSSKFFHHHSSVYTKGIAFGSIVGFSGSADIILQLSVTFNDPEAQFQGHSIVTGEYLTKSAPHPFHVM